MITVVHIDGLTGINYHRIVSPFSRLVEMGLEGVCFIKKLEELKSMDLDKVDNLVVSRKLSVTDHNAFKKMLSQHNIKLILDNDDYWDLNKDNPHWQIYEVYYGPDIEATIKIADIIWTPSKYLAKKMKELNPKAVVDFVNNGIRDDEAQWVNQKKKNNSKVSYGYLGAAAHTNDVKIIGYRFWNKNLFCIQDLGYKEILKANRTLKPKSIFHYGSYYKKIDVSLAPLEENIFNLCKSDLKVTEAAVTKTAIIASNIDIYNGSIVNGETGILCSNKEEWKDAIESMTKEKAKSMGLNLHESLKNDPNHNLDLINNIRLKYLL